MTILKNKINLLFYSSIIFFIITCSTHIFNKNKIAKAIPFSGSAGGRIVTIFRTLEPPPAGPCVGIPCACSATLTTIIAPYGGAGSLFCFPIANKPIAGPSLTISSMGYKLIGFFTVSEPTTASTNWGTSF